MIAWEWISRMFNSNSNVIAAGITKIDLWKSGVSNNNNSNNKMIHSKILSATNQQQLTDMITLAKKEVKEISVVKIIKSELKLYESSDIRLHTPRLDHQVDSREEEKGNDDEEEDEDEVEKQQEEDE
jgi:hypothetical protein